MLQEQIQDYNKKIGSISNDDIDLNLNDIFTRATGKFRMKSEKILSNWKEQMINKMDNISDYDNQLLIGNQIILR